VERSRRSSATLDADRPPHGVARAGGAMRCAGIEGVANRQRHQPPSGYARRNRRSGSPDRLGHLPPPQAWRRRCSTASRPRERVSRRGGAASGRAGGALCLDFQQPGLGGHQAAWSRDHPDLAAVGTANRSSHAGVEAASRWIRCPRARLRLWLSRI